MHNIYEYYPLELERAPGPEGRRCELEYKKRRQCGGWLVHESS